MLGVRFQTLLSVDSFAKGLFAVDNVPVMPEGSPLLLTFNEGDFIISYQLL